MARTLSDVSPEELEALIERAIDRRLQVWLTQIMDALRGPDDDDEAEFKPKFEASLRRALDQAQRGEGVDLQAFRSQLGR